MTYETLEDTKQEAIRQVKISFADRYIVEYVTQKWGLNNYRRITLDEAINYINNANYINVESGDVYLGNAAIISRDVS